MAVMNDCPNKPGILFLFSEIAFSLLELLSDPFYFTAAHGFSFVTIEFSLSIMDKSLPLDEP